MQIKFVKMLVEFILDNQLNHLRSHCPKDVTDLVFLEIENNYGSVYGTILIEYAKSQNRKIRDAEDTIRQTIGKHVKDYWNLTNGVVCNDPKSILINNYTEH